jgi:uncharacterized protein (DUF58 family)
MQSILDFLLQRPFVLLLLLALPFLLLARLRGIYPSPRLLFWFSLIVAVSTLMVRFPVVAWAVLVLDVIFLVVIAIDCFTIVAKKRFTATRSVGRVASLGKPQNVSVELNNGSNFGCNLTAKDDLPQIFTAEPAEFPVTIDGKSRTRFDYRFTSNRRGNYLMQCLHLAVRSKLTLWQAFYKIPVDSSIHIYPDMRQIAEYDLLARTNRLSLVGVRRTRRIGQDNEFERLRDYSSDDNYKHIDWRTTARRRKLTVRDFQANQSQRIIFMVDCGRMMTGKSGKFSLLDHAVNAMLMLSYVALRQGDSVGLLCFSDGVHSFTPPRNGVNHINRLLNATFDQSAHYVESRYDDAFIYLQKNCPKRSLVVLLTNVIDEVNAHQVLQYTSQLTGRHLPLCMLVKDHDLFEMVEQYDENPSDESLYTAAASANILTWRKQVITDLKRQGVLAVDTFPEKMTAQLINEYLEIKARHLL